MTGGRNFRSIVEREDVDHDVRTVVEHVFDGWYENQTRLDWVNFFDRMEDIQLQDGRWLDLGCDMSTPAIKEIKRYVAELKRQL